MSGEKLTTKFDEEPLTIFIMLFAGGISAFDLAYKCLPEFELPFVVISLIVLLFPLILFVGYIILSRIRVKAQKRKCERHIGKVKKCLNDKATSQD